MPTPPKPVKVIEMEGKSHRTKKELAQRKRAEEELLTGIRMEEKPEVEANKEAHKEFQHLKKLLAQIGKDDDLYGNAINRYCIMTAECNEICRMQEESRIALENFQKQREQLISDGEAYREGSLQEFQDSLEKNYQKYSQLLTAKRKALADAEKEKQHDYFIGTSIYPEDCRKEKQSPDGGSTWLRTEKPMLTQNGA